MSRRVFRCRNGSCAVLHGAVLGRLTLDGGLALDPSVRAFRCYFDTQQAIITCPKCGQSRVFGGRALRSQRSESPP